MEGNVSQLQFCRYQATLGGIVVAFWATSDGETIGPQGRRVDASLGATTTSEPETLPSELFDMQDVGENLRCGNVWEAVPALIMCLGPLLDRLCAVASDTPPRVLELGAGMGLPGLWAAARGAEVVLTDSNLAVLELLERNARFLGEGAPAVRALDWAALPDWITGAEFDLVIASDVLYDCAAVEPFFGVVAAALKPGGTLLVSHTDRGIVSFDEAIQRAQVEFGLSWTAEASGGEGGGLGESIACHTFEKDF